MDSHKFVFVPLGSAGDVNPMIWLARLLAGRGHEVCVVMQAAMAEYAARAGLNHVPVGCAEEQRAFARNPELWHPRRGFAHLARHFPAWGKEMVPHIRREIIPGKTTLIGAGIAFGARIVAETDAIPYVTVALQPSILMSAHDIPVLMAGMEPVKKRPLWLRRFLLWLGYLETDRLMRRPVNRVRREFGLTTPARNIMARWAVSPDLVLALFPEWFGPSQPDWPRNTRTTRFPLYDEAGVRPLDPAMEAFLSAAEPPVLMTPGSANAHGRDFFEAGVAACRNLNRRALLVTPFKDQIPQSLPAGSAHFEFAPFGQVFPRCSAVIHHGGIGTSSQALAAGVPQLIMAMSFDQPDNGYRLKGLGVGDYLYPRQFTAPRVQERLAAFLDGSASAACARVRQSMQDQMPPEQVARILEEFAASRIAR